MLRGLRQSRARFADRAKPAADVSGPAAWQTSNCVVDAGETAQDAGIAAVTAGEREFGEQLGNPLIEHRAVVAASLVTEGTSKPRFADAGRPAQNQIVVRVDPFAIGELVE